MKIICPRCKAEYDIEPQPTEIEAECPCGQKFIVPAVATSSSSSVVNPHSDLLHSKVPTIQRTSFPDQQKTLDYETEVWSGSPSWVHYLDCHLLGLILLPIVIGVVFILYAELDRRTRIFVVTKKRITTQEGIISRQTNEVRIKDVRSINVKQNCFERMVGIGTIEIGSSGHAGIEARLLGIPSPFEVRDRIRLLMDSADQ